MGTLKTNNISYKVTTEYFSSKYFKTMEESYDYFYDIKEKSKCDKGWAEATKKSKVLRVITTEENVTPKFKQRGE